MEKYHHYHYHHQQVSSQVLAVLTLADFTLTELTKDILLVCSTGEFGFVPSVRTLIIEAPDVRRDRWLGAVR